MKRKKLSDSVAEEILVMIKNKEYDSEGFLPSEQKLLEKFEVSRVTVREAVKTLEVRGLVKRIHGKGILVVDNTANVLIRSIKDLIATEGTSLDEMLEVRDIVEPKCAEIAAIRRTEEDLLVLREKLEIMESCQAMDNKYYGADLDFHLGIARATGNTLLSSLIEAYTSYMRKLIVSTPQSKVPIEQEFHYHRNILNEIEKGDSEKAAEKMSMHLSATRLNVQTYNADKSLRKESKVMQTKKQY